MSVAIFEEKAQALAGVAMEHLFLLVPAQQYVGKFLATFKEFPPRQKVGSFGIDQVLGKLTQGAGN